MKGHRQFLITLTAAGLAVALLFTLLSIGARTWKYWQSRSSYNECDGTHQIKWDIGCR